MKKALPILIMLLIGAVATSFAQECYQSTRSKGISLFNQGKKKEAKKFFEAAKDCPDKPSNNDLQEWINKCDTDNTSSGGSKGNKVTVASLTFLNPNQGSDGLAKVGFYLDELGMLKPKVIIENGAKSNKKVTVGLVVKDPDGNLIEYDGGNTYTESRSVTLKSGFNEVIFSEMGNYTESLVGNYAVEVWIDKKKQKETPLQIMVRPTTIAVNGNTQGFEERLNPEGGSLTFSVSSSTGGFLVKHSPSWVTVNSNGEDELTIVYERNPLTSERVGKMDVYTDNEKRWLVIDLVQDGNPNQQIVHHILMKAGLNLGLPNFSVSASSALGSVVDYGVTDVPSLASLEEPNYKTGGSFGASFDVDIFFSDNIFVETGVAFQHYAVTNSFENNRLRYTTGGVAYHMDYGCKERYRLNYLQVPILGGYRLKINSVSSVSFNAGLVLGIGLSAKCKLENGYSNFTLDNGDYAKSTYSGEINLYSGKYSIKQQYSTGSQPYYNYQGTKSNPLKRFNLGLNIGAAYDLGSVEIGLSYMLGLSNIGNRNYFGSTNRVGGCLFAGDVIASEEGIYGYKQRLNCLQAHVSIWF